MNAQSTACSFKRAWINTYFEGNFNGSIHILWINEWSILCFDGLSANAFPWKIRFLASLQSLIYNKESKLLCVSSILIYFLAIESTCGGALWVEAHFYARARFVLAALKSTICIYLLLKHSSYTSCVSRHLRGEERIFYANELLITTRQRELKATQDNSDFEKHAPSLKHVH